MQAGQALFVIDPLNLVSASTFDIRSSFGFLPSSFSPAMPSRRLLKAAEAIREVVGMAILTDLQDPRVRDVTVTGVEVAPDMRQAKVFVSVMGNESKQNLSLRGLQSAAGYLQSKVARHENHPTDPAGRAEPPGNAQLDDQHRPASGARAEPS
jgi:ribosome-binding factor A